MSSLVFVAFTVFELLKIFRTAVKNEPPLGLTGLKQLKQLPVEFFKIIVGKCFNGNNWTATLKWIPSLTLTLDFFNLIFLRKPKTTALAASQFTMWFFFTSLTWLLTEVAQNEILMRSSFPSFLSISQLNQGCLIFRVQLSLFRYLPFRYQKNSWTFDW